MQNYLRASGDREQHDKGQTENMEQRQHRKLLFRLFVRAKSVPMRVDAEHCAEISVREHGPLWLTGRASGVLQHRDLILDRAVRVASERAVVGDEHGEIDLAAGSADPLRRWPERRRNRSREEVRDTAHNQRLELASALQRGNLRIEHRQFERNHHPGFGILDLVFEFPRCGERAEIDDTPACHEHREEADHEMRRVWQVQTNVHTGADAERLQAFSGSGREVA